MSQSVKIFMQEQHVATVVQKEDGEICVQTRDDGVYQFLTYLYNNACDAIATIQKDDIRGKFNQTIMSDSADFFIAVTQHLPLTTPFYGVFDVE